MERLRDAKRISRRQTPASLLLLDVLQDVDMAFDVLDISLCDSIFH